ncbi:MAG TPA: trehalose-6-phosphate synthase, partial [Oligoflexia bacterium]|nr:trehalose-6-phosphate synthase [Oligoflexia bacterium]
VKSYPISIAWPPPHAQDAPGNQPCRSAVIKRHNLSETSLIAVGVERLDYTKGILERFLAVERMLDIHPQWRGQFTMIQIAAPSRSKLDAYRQFRAHAFAEAERINNKFGELANPPILVLERHHSPAEVLEYLRAANVCLVTSLHDGMNLVAKEFVGARSDLGGVLILSMFAGASRELPEALIVNPYNIDQCAQAIDFALQMPLAEQNRRMQSMREQIQQFNVYRWAGRMLIDAAQVRKKEQLSREISEFRLQED